MSFKLLLFLRITCFLTFPVKFAYSVPSDYCLEQLNTTDCGAPPTPVFHYYKPGSRCELGIWRGCPSSNMFADEYQCSNMCIYRFNQDTNIEEENWESEIKNLPDGAVKKINKILNFITIDTMTDSGSVESITESTIPDLTSSNEADSNETVKDSTTQETRVKNTTEPADEGNENTTENVITTENEVTTDSVVTTADAVTTEKLVTKDDVAATTEVTTEKLTTERVITTENVITTESTTVEITTKLVTTAPTTKGDPDEVIVM